MNRIKNVWKDWEIRELIGEGSFSKVYRIEKRIGDTVDICALKVISVPRSQSDIKQLSFDGFTDENVVDFLNSVVKSFTSEIETMIKFRGCANIVSIQDYTILEKEEGIGWDIYIRMELLTPLNAYAASHKMSEEEIINAGLGLCSALQAFEKNNPPLIHRDIKPSNIFVSDYGVFKIGDFGTVREVEKTYGSYTRIGTPDYMAPEVRSRGEYSTVSDIYSVGLVLYKLANDNLLPFADRAVTDIHEKSSSVERRFSGETFPKPKNASKRLSEVILKACSYKPSARYRSAGEFYNALKAVSEPVRKKPLISAAAAIASVAVLLAVGIFSLRGIIGNDIPVSDITSSTSGTSASTAASTTSTSVSETNRPVARETSTTVSTTEASVAEILVTAETTASLTTSQSAITSTTVTPTETSTSATTTKGTTVTKAKNTTTTKAVTKSTKSEAKTKIITATKKSTKPKTETAEETPEISSKTTSDERIPMPDFDYVCSEEDYEYLDYLTGVTITQYNGMDMHIEIPDVLGGKRVLQIGENAFANNQWIQSVIIPEGVSELCNGAFNGCSYLTDISLPDTLRSIRSNAIYNCPYLKSVYIPAKVSVIESLNFGWCAIEELVVDSKNRYYTTIDGVLFDEELKTLLFYPCGKSDAEYSIPEGVETIEMYSVDRPQFLKKLILPDSLRNFSPYQVMGSIEAFEADGDFFLSVDGVLYSKDKKTLVSYPCMKSDTSYIIPDGTERIGILAVYEAAYLVDITIPDSVDKLYIDSIHNCFNLTDIFYKGKSYKNMTELMSDNNSY